MQFEVGQKVELNDLGKRRVEGNHTRRPRLHGEIIGISKAYVGSVRIKWQSRKSEDHLHGDFLKTVSEFIDPVAGPWQPIETAPTDGSRILAGSKPDQWVCCAYYETDKGHEGWREDGTHWTDATDGSVNPTHWQPMPEPPQ